MHRILSSLSNRVSSRLALRRTPADLRYRRLLENSREIICETDRGGRWTYLNPAWTQLTGQEVAASLGTSSLCLVEPEDHPAVLERLASLYRGECEECSYDVRFRHVNGEIRWASVRSHLMRDERGEVVGTYGNIHDVTDRRAAEAARLDSERLYRLLADNSNDMIVRLSLQGVRRYVSPASLNLLGYTPEELVAEAPAGAIHPDDRAIAVAACRSLLDGVENPMCVYRQLRKDGSYVWLEASYRLICDDDGAPLEVIATVRDVSRREKAELARLTATNQLSEANRLLLMAEEMSRVGHWRVDLASGAVWWSDVVCAIHSRPRGHVPTLDEAVAFYHPGDRAMVQAAVDDAVTHGKHFGFSARIVRHDGVVRHVVSSGRAETGPDGSAVGLFGVIQDVSEAYDASQALQTASRRLSESNRMLTMAETVGKLGHWRIDYRTNDMFWSEEVYRIYGLPPDLPPVAETALALYHPDDVGAVRDAVRHARQSGEGYTSQARVLRADGSTVHIATRAEVEFDAAGTAIALFGIVQDVSDRVAAEGELQESEARFRLLTEQVSDVISLHDVSGSCLFMSPSVQTVLGYTAGEMQGDTLQSLALPADQRIISGLKRQLAVYPFGHVVTGRFRLRHRDGTSVWIESGARVVKYRRQPRIVVVSRDVSDQVRAEEDLAAARDRAEDAATAKSSFLANMSHEIRTPMNGVVGFTDLMLADALSAPQRRRAEMIAESGRAMMRLLNDILDLSKVEAGQMTIASDPFDLRQTLEACMTLVMPALEKKELAARFEFAADVPSTVRGDALRLRQVVLNLLGNAAKFTECGSVLLRVAAGDDDRIEIAVVDTGIGISPDRQAAVFDQFAQEHDHTTSRFGGTGLGLTISARLAALMGGDLRLESTPGQGTTFSLSIPLPVAEPTVPPVAVAVQDAVAAAPVSGLRPRVLVAEDHDVNQLLIAELLDALGYDCELAVDGEEAVALATAGIAERRHVAVLMDMRMPGVDGLEATRRIRAAGADAVALPIIALTANAYADDVSACLAAGMQAHLVKPVARDVLLASLRKWSSQTVLPVDQTPPPARPKVSVQERYAARRQDALDAVGRLIRESGACDMQVAEVAELLHQLAGTAGMFGEGELGDQARRIELGLRDWSADERATRLPDELEVMQRLAA